MMETVAANPAIFAPLFLLLSLGVSWFLVWVAERSPAAPFFQTFAGVSPFFVGTISLLFGLMTAFLANEAWNQQEKARSSITQEADAIRTITTIAQGLGERGKKLDGLVADYGRNAAGDDWRSPAAVAAANGQIDSMLRETLFGDAAASGNPVSAIATNAVNALRTAYHARVSAGQSATGRQKWLAAVFLGLLAQMGIVTLNLGKLRPSLLAVTLTAAAMAFVLWAILARVDPFGGRQPVSLEPITAAYTRSP